MIKFDHVEYEYQSEKFLFNLDLQKGAFVAILGVSGAGKSTLLNLAAGFIAPFSGDIIIDAKSVLTMPPHRRPLSILFQEKNLFSHLNVADNIGLGLAANLKLNRAQKKQIVAISEQVGIEHLLTRLPSELSGGQKQRVALARCFIQGKPLLLLDEPFSALDPILRQEMLNIVSELASKKGVTVLMVTHHLADAVNAASDYLFIDQGNIISSGNVARLNDDNQPSAVKQFVTAG